MNKTMAELQKEYIIQVYTHTLVTHTLPNLSQLELEFKVEYQTQVGIPSWIRIQIEIPTWIVDPLGECSILVERKYLRFFLVHCKSTMVTFS